jgi:hypothetical protein
MSEQLFLSHRSRVRQAHPHPRPFWGESLTVPRPPASGESLIVPYCILVARTLRQSLGEVEWLLTASTDISRQVQGGPAPGKSLNSPGESALLINE